MKKGNSTDYLRCSYYPILQYIEYIRYLVLNFWVDTETKGITWFNIHTYKLLLGVTTIKDFDDLSDRVQLTSNFTKKGSDFK